MTRPTVSDPFDTLPRSHPEWAIWLSLLRKAHGAAQDPGWTSALTATERREDTDDRPLLAGMTLPVHEATIARWTRELFEAAATGTAAAAELARAAQSGDVDPLALLEASVNEDDAIIGALAREAGVDATPLRALTPLLALPLLSACARSLAGHATADWRHGYCPTCGAWPALAEARGLERSRHLRCGRCGGDWRTEWMRCPYCGTGEHTRLGALVSEVTGETRKIDTCEACRGYLKTLMTLTVRSPIEVALDDLTTVALDIAALEHGYRRPQGPGYPLAVTLVAAASRPDRSLRRWLR